MEKLNHSRERLIVGSLVLVAVVLALTPWSLRYSADPTAPISASIIAGLLALAALLAQWHRVRPAASFALAAGAWAMLSPLVFGFWDQPAAFWSHVVAGILAVLLSIGETQIERDAAAKLAAEPGEDESSGAMAAGQPQGRTTA